MCLYDRFVELLGIHRQLIPYVYRHTKHDNDIIYCKLL